MQIYPILNFWKLGGKFEKNCKDYNFNIECKVNNKKKIEKTFNMSAQALRIISKTVSIQINA